MKYLIFMNTILHFLLSFVFVDIIFGNAKNYILPILLFSVIVDLDHIPYLLKVKKDLIKKRFGAESRSIFHELVGLFVFSLIFCISFFFLPLNLIRIISFCLVIHISIDFLFGTTRPFYPFSNKKIFLGLFSKRFIYLMDLFLTLILLIFVIGYV